MSCTRLAAKVDAAGPAVVVIVAFIVHEATVLDDLPVQPEDVDGQVVAASIAVLSAVPSHTSPQPDTHSLQDDLSAVQP